MLLCSSIAHLRLVCSDLSSLTVIYCGLSLVSPLTTESDLLWPVAFTMQEGVDDIKERMLEELGTPENNAK